MLAPLRGREIRGVPALFLPLGLWAWASVLINVLLAEALTNLHGFLTVVRVTPARTCAGSTSRYETAREFYLRQILGSAITAAVATGTTCCTGG